MEKLTSNFYFRRSLYSKISKSIILSFIIFVFGLQNEHARHSKRRQNMQISTVDAISCVKLSSHYGIREEQAMEWDVFCYQRAYYRELQNTTYTEGTVLLIFPKEEVRRTQSCLRFVRIHRPNCKASVLCSLHIEQCCYRRLFNGRDPLQWRCQLWYS